MTNDQRITPDDWFEFFVAITATLALLWCLGGSLLLIIPK